MGRARASGLNNEHADLDAAPRRHVYLQTWHGTPLKRMLHDLDTVVGRDSDYVDRVDWIDPLKPGRCCSSSPWGC